MQGHNYVTEKYFEVLKYFKKLILINSRQLTKHVWQHDIFLYILRMEQLD